MPTLKEITTRAKKIRKAKPRTKWQNAIKQASKELKASYRKKEGKIAAKKTTAKLSAKKTKKGSTAITKKKKDKKGCWSKKTYVKKCSINGNAEVKEYIDVLSDYKKTKSQNSWLMRFYRTYIDGSYDNYNEAMRLQDAVFTMFSKGITKPAQVRSLRMWAIMMYKKFIKKEFGLTDYQQKKALEMVFTKSQIETFMKQIKEMYNPKYY
jgi:hypothetical protein